MRNDTRSSRVIRSIIAVIAVAWLILPGAPAKAQLQVIIPPLPPQQLNMQGVQQLQTLANQLNSSLNSTLTSLITQITGLQNFGSLQSNITSLNNLGNFVNISGLGTDYQNILQNLNLNSLMQQIMGGGNPPTLGLISNINTMFTGNGGIQQVLNQLNLGNLNPAQIQTAITNLSSMMSGMVNLNNMVSQLNSNLTSLTGTLGNLTSLSNLSPTQLLSIPNLGQQLGALDGLATGQLSGLTNLASGFGAINGAFGSLSQFGGLSNLTNPNQLISNGVSAAMGAISTQIGGLGTQLAGLNGSLGSVLGGSPVGNIANGMIGTNNLCPFPFCANVIPPIECAVYGQTNCLDNRYKNIKMIGAMPPVTNPQLPVQIDQKGPQDGTQGAMPHSAMKHKDTMAISLVAQYPWLYKETDGNQYVLYRGTGNNDYSDVDDPIPFKLSDEDDSDTVQNYHQNDALVDTTDINKIQCKALNVKCQGGSTTGKGKYTNYEYFIRFQYDGCANQYLLPMALNPDFIFFSSYAQHKYPWNESLCQPLVLTALPCVKDNVNPANKGKCKPDKGESDKKLYDYRAWGYLERAWKDVLASNYSPSQTSNNNYIPAGGGGMLSYTTPIKGFDTYGTPFNYATPGNGDVNAQYKGNLTTIVQLTQRPYERIWDTTHPYTPRWDMTHSTDRDYSTKTWLTGIPGMGYTPVISNCNVRCAAVPVDILTFRAPEFNACMGCRIDVNTSCFWTEVWFQMLPPPIGPDLDYGTALSVVTAGTAPAPICKTPLYQAGKWPPCSTAYDSPKDNVPPMCKACVTLANDSSSSVSTSVTKCCNDLAAALAPINTLKIRNRHKDNTDDSKGNMPEGYSFKDYFGTHMPYMRWWDTGMAAGGLGTVNAGADKNDNFDPNCDVGQYDTIVGQGIEGRSCRYGGGTGKGYSCVTNVALNDRLTSWYELKQVQSYALRDYGLNCIPMHEKVSKQLGTEDGALFQAGKHFNSMMHPDNDPKNSVFEYQPVPWPLRWRGFLSDQDNPNDQFPKFDGGGGSGGMISGGLDNAQTGDIIFLLPQDSPKDVMPFIAVVTVAHHNTGNTKANCSGQGKCFDDNVTCTDRIQVVDVNNGKYPDACGETNYVGMGQTRTIYKEQLPNNILESLYQGGTNIKDSCGDSYTVGTGATLNLTAAGNCKDPKYHACTFAANGGPGLWNTIKVYRPKKDQRN